MEVKAGIIGGSGMDDPRLMEDMKEQAVKTPYGTPSSKLTVGRIGGVGVVVLARHGRDHSVYPTGVNFRANIYALKEAGCTHVIATTAVGSLKAGIKPGDLVFPDQFLDFTRLRPLTFHDTGEVVHTPMADPFCAATREALASAAKAEGLAHHKGATVVTIEGPRFSTRAESNMFRLLGGDVINMSTVPEAQLAREAGLCYQPVAMSTDYDCWKEDEEPVTWEMIQSRMAQNAHNVKRLIKAVLPMLKPNGCCRAGGH